MRGALTRITPPATAPLTPEELRTFLRLDGFDDLAVLADAIAGVVAEVDGKDGWLGRALVTQTWDWTLDRFPWGGQALEVPLPPLQSVTSIQYVDPAGVLQTWDPAEYQVDTTSEPGRIAPAVGLTYPATRDDLGAVRIRFVAGYGTPDRVPADLKLGLKEKVALAFEERGGVVVGAGVAVIPGAGDARLARYRTRWF